MICHRTLGPNPHPRYLYDRSKVTEAEIAALAQSQPHELVAVSDTSGIVTTLPNGSPCLGSRCMMWAPQMQRGTILGAPDYSEDQQRALPEDITPTGYGWCHDNMRTAAIPDPAKGA